MASTSTLQDSVYCVCRQCGHVRCATVIPRRHIPDIAACRLAAVIATVP